MFCFSKQGDFLFAQSYEADTLSINYLMNREKSFNISIHTLGYGIGYRIGKQRDYFNSRFWDFDLLEMKSPNQIHTYNPYFTNTKSYVYSKLNNLYILRGGYGRQHLLYDKPYWGGMEVRFFYSGGVSAGIARPVYLYIAYYEFVQNLTVYTLELEKYDPEKHFNVATSPCNCEIYGGGPLFSGFNEIKLYPGAFGKIGFNFEFSKRNDRIRALEVGGVIDFFPKGVPIMAFRDPYNLFLTGYISYHFGKRYN